MDDGDDRGSGNFDDLFDDLDRFFQPSDDPSAQADRREVATRDTERRRPEDPDAVAPDLGEPTISVAGPEPVIHTSGGPKAQVPVPARPGSQDDAQEAEWARLHDVLREPVGPGDLGAASLGGSAPPAVGDPLSDFPSAESEHDGRAGGYGAEWTVPERGEDEPPELTLEDLKKPPPQYRDLPVGDPGPGPEGAAGEGGDPEPAVLDELFGEEPDIADVELAADQLAREFAPGSGEEPEELGEVVDDEGPPPPRPAPERRTRTVRVGEPESMVGPTWEEPTSQVVTADRPQGPRVSEGRNLPAAILTAVVLAAALLVSVFVAPWLFTIVAGAVVLLGQFELYTTMQRRGFRPASALGLVIGGLMAAGAYFRGEAALLTYVGLGLLASFLWVMASPPKAREGAVANVGTTMLGVLYAPFLASYYVLILMNVESGRSVMLAVLGLTFLYDAAAYFFGSFWGSRALAPTISPKKSWEGLLGATVIVYAIAIAFLPAIGPLSLGSAVGLATVVVLFAPLGDLAESMIKRDLGVKDMGSVLPGHGGILDRIDSALFVGIAAFYFLRLVLG
jgi:phosphatidate cytidylyltransferase